MAHRRGESQGPSTIERVPYSQVMAGLVAQEKSRVHKISKTLSRVDSRSVIFPKLARGGVTPLARQSGGRKMLSLLACGFGKRLQLLASAVLSVGSAR